MIAQVDITGVRLETDRLILRPWTMDDLQCCLFDGHGGIYTRTFESKKRNNECYFWRDSICSFV